MTTFKPTLIDLIPIPSPHIETEVIGNEVLLYHPQQTRAVYLNATAALVWGLCDGKRTVREMVSLIGREYSESRDSLMGDVLITLNELQESGILAAG